MLTALHFAPVESGHAYLAALRDRVMAHGRPLAFYSDRHGIFRVNAKDAQIGDGKTEFGWIVERLDIALINALTPQAKACVSYYTSFAWLMVIGIKRVQPPRPGRPWAIV